jgi:hypothetical protein
MRLMRKAAATATLVVLLVAALAGLTFAQSGSGLVRFVHALPGAGAIDIYVNGLPTVRGLDFGQGTGFVGFPASENAIVVTQSGTTTPVWQQSYSPAVGSAATMVVSSADPLQFTPFVDDLSPLPLGRSRITAIHAIAGAPTVDVVLEDGRAVVAGLTYNTPYGTLDIPALVYPLAVVPTGGAIADAILPVTPFALSSGTAYVIVAYGTPSNPQALVLSAPTAPEAAGGFLRVVHGVSGAPAVNVFVNETLAVPALEFGAASSFIAVPAGSYTATIRAVDTEEDIASANLNLSVDDYVTAAALLDGEDVVITAFIDEPSLADSAASAIAVYNGFTGSEATFNVTTLEAALAGAPLVAEDGSATVAAFQPNAAGLSIATDGADGVTLAEPVSYGGAYYSALAYVGDDGLTAFALPPVSLSQTIGSAPGSPLAAVAAPTDAAIVAAPTATVLPMTEPTAVPQVVAPTTDPNVVVAATAAPQVVQATPLPAGPTARIILDPGANLQLRQYPSRDAFSLGLAPSGAVLLVNGRQGEAEFNIPGVASPTPDPLVTPIPDPASLLGEDEDLFPGDTWLNVIYITPDGGQIEAWVNAQFLDVRDDRGRLQRLADLPTIPENRAGEARDTAITPPPTARDFAVATVFNLDQAANLQIRRTPNTAGESLALVGNGTTMELLGVNETRDWAFVRYSPPEGGEVTGWASTIFLQYSFRNESQTLDELFERERTEVIPDDRRGAIGVGTSGPVAPTRDPLRNVVVGEVVLDAGANLHLRRNPNPNSESLALIPTGTQLLVQGRTDTNEWVQVEFEGQMGWVSSLYIVLTFNGASYDLLEVPVTVFSGLPTATATPG